jgi:hypothetical protein
MSPPSRAHRRARRHRHERRARDAMDAATHLTKRVVADGQAVWSRSPDAGINPRVTSPRGRRLTSPVLRGEYGAAVQPSCRECRSDFGVPVVTMLVCFSHFANEAMGAACTRHSLRPLLIEGRECCITRAQFVSRECGLTPSPLSSPALCALAHWGGRSSIPETVVLGREASGILDAPHSRGMTARLLFDNLTDERERKCPALTPPLPRRRACGCPGCDRHSGRRCSRGRRRSHWRHRSSPA